jgi:predicted phosphoribosyltransferase
MPFENRLEAARRLATRLETYRDRHPLVLAIPRGAVPMGKVVADALGADLDVVLVRKLRAPDNPELAIGSIPVFLAIGLHFRDFSQVQDEEVVKILREARLGRSTADATGSARG